MTPRGLALRGATKPKEATFCIFLSCYLTPRGLALRGATKPKEAKKNYKPINKKYHERN